MRRDIFPPGEMDGNLKTRYCFVDIYLYHVYNEYKFIKWSFRKMHGSSMNVWVIFVL